jgi:hypothetical protein
MILPAAGVRSAGTIENPDYPLTEETITNTLKSDTDSGYVITRRKYTRVIHRFTMKWSHLPGSDVAEIKAFFEAVGGAAGSWEYIHQLTSAKYTVRFKDDILKFDLAVPGPESSEGANDGGYYSGTIVLEEV